MNRFIGLIVAISLVLSVLYIPQPIFAEPLLPTRYLDLGSQGADVIILQEALNKLGYSIKVDGVYGVKTKQAISELQSNANLKPDGVYGPNTGSYLTMILSEKQDSDNGQAPSEENVNENLNEDMALTYDAERKGLTNMVSHQFIEANRDSLIEPNVGIPVLKEWNTRLPEELKENIQYDKYTMAYDYLLVISQTLNIRKQPNTQSAIEKKAGYYDKLNVIQEVQGEYLPRYGSNNWYRVFWHENGTIKFGYVFSKLAEPRSFRFEKMLEKVKVLQNTIAENKIGYISNYKNINGFPPAYKGANLDAYSYARSQSAPGYLDTKQSDFRYFPDGMIVTIITDVEGYYKVTSPSFEGEYFIPKKYITFKNVPKELKKVVVIDDLNQNEGVFQFSENQWELISYSYATTGIVKKYSYETPKGHFMAIEKKPYFLYLEDGTTKISGFAPYAVRFSAGGYIHGVPIDFKPEQNRYNTSPTDPSNHEEYLFTIGTTPRSHKCVRNFTSHAKFLYEWAEIGSTAVIVIN